MTAYGYPEELGRMFVAPVLNRGRDGITTADALRELPSVLADNPQAVVVELGGHDFLKGRGRDRTRANLEQILRACRARGAEVVLLEIPRGLVRDPFRGLERELARRHDLELVSDTPLRLLVLGSPYGPPGMWLPPERRLSDDGLHPNSRGNRLLARHVAAALVRLYGDVVLRRKSGERPSKPSRHPSALRNSSAIRRDLSRPRFSALHGRRENRKGAGGLAGPAGCSAGSNNLWATDLADLG